MTDLCPDSPPIDLDRRRTGRAVAPTVIDGEPLSGNAAPDDTPQIVEPCGPRRAVGARQAWFCSLRVRISEAWRALRALRSLRASKAGDERAERAHRSREAQLARELFRAGLHHVR